MRTRGHLGCLATVVLCVACAGGPPIDDPAELPCPGDTYDPCLDEHTCASLNCRPFAAEQFQICTQRCDVDNPCPGESDGAVCDESAGAGLGVCKPVIPNVCKAE
jgi:hypothetical protein